MQVVQKELTRDKVKSKVAKLKAKFISKKASKHVRIAWKIDQQKHNVSCEFLFFIEAGLS